MLDFLFCAQQAKRMFTYILLNRPHISDHSFRLAKASLLVELWLALCSKIGITPMATPMGVATKRCLKDLSFKLDSFG